MPHYYFHLSAPGRYSVDDVGVEYSGVEAAYLDAYQAALDMSIEMLRQRLDPARHSFEIADQAGQVLFELPFAEVMRPHHNPPPSARLEATIKQRWVQTRHVTEELKSTLRESRSLISDTKDLLSRLNR